LVADPFKPNFDTWKGQENLSFNPKSKEEIYRDVLKEKYAKEALDKESQTVEGPVAQANLAELQRERTSRDAPIQTQGLSEMNRRNEEIGNKGLKSGIQAEGSPKP